MSEDEDIINELGYCFQELIDNEFKITINQIISGYVDFKKGQHIVSVTDVILNEYNKNKIPYFYVVISKDIKTNKSFNIKDIIEDVLTSESYMKQEFKLNIKQLTILSDDFYCYDSTKYLPLDKDINTCLTIYFTKY